MSELARLHDLAMTSTDESVQAFGIMILGRIAYLADGKTDPYLDDIDAMQPLICAGREINLSEEMEATK
jgi:hypothetical protein